MLTQQVVLVQVRFINAAAPHIGTEAAYAHGANLVLLDGIGLGVGMPLQVSLLVQALKHLQVSNFVHARPANLFETLIYFCAKRSLLLHMVCK